MTRITADRDAIKDGLRQLIAEEPTFILDLLTEAIRQRRQKEVPENDEERTAYIERLVQEDFDRYDEVFKALA